jgi:DNA polymerase III delta prime subunit
MPLIIFTAESPAGRDAVVKFLEETAEKQGRHHSDDEDHPYIFTPAKYAGEWNCRNMLPPRPLTSVYLKNGQLDRLVNDMQAFLDNSDHYKRLSQPWHRGYLFYGPPGTGKTSMARALSDHFNLDMHWLSLADVDKDQDLVQLISNIESRSILLLEDIDAFDTAKDRDGKDGKHASIAALLNALDGVWTPDGLITIMTTNEPDKLDRALVRAGRVGMAEEFGYMDMEQVQAMAGYADWHPDRPEEFVGKSPADFMEAASRALLGLDAQVDEILTQVLGAAA